jgi:hypothetical protein
MKKFKLPTVTAIVAICLLAVVFNSCQKDLDRVKNMVLMPKTIIEKNDWALSGHVNQENNKEFIINDSLVIKSGDFVTLMTVFCHGTKTKCLAFQHLFKNDAELIRHLQWQYEVLFKDEKIYKPAVVGGFK